MANFIARRVGSSDFALFADGIQFGRLANCEVAYVFVAVDHADERLAGYIDYRLEGDMSLRELLAAVRAGYEVYERDLAAEAAHDMECEGAWLRAAEYNPEHLAEMDADDQRCG